MVCRAGVHSTELHRGGTAQPATARGRHVRTSRHEAGEDKRRRPQGRDGVSEIREAPPRQGMRQRHVATRHRSTARRRVSSVRTRTTSRLRASRGTVIFVSVSETTISRCDTWGLGNALTCRSPRRRVLRHQETEGQDAEADLQPGDAGHGPTALCAQVHRDRRGAPHPAQPRVLRIPARGRAHVRLQRARAPRRALHLPHGRPARGRVHRPRRGGVRCRRAAARRPRQRTP
jgi:hypothetical protein